MFMLRMSIVTSDGLVSDDYYKEGRAYNKTLERDEMAAQLSAQAIVRLDDVTGDINVRLAGDFQPFRKIWYLKWSTLPARASIKR